VGTVNADVIDFAPGNAIVTCIACVDATGAPTGSIPGADVGSIVQNFGHSTTTGLLKGGVNVSPTGFGADFEWTVKFAFAEAIIANFGTPGGIFATGSAVVAGGANFFEIYYDGATDASNLAGTGFDDGTLILAGTILPFDSTTGTGVTTFLGSGIDDRLDNFGTDQYTGIDSVVGTGGGNLQVQVTFRNSSFFLDDIVALEIPVDTLLGLAYDQTDPSSCFTPTAGLSAGATFLGAGNGYGGCGAGATGSVGATNGIDGPNGMFQTDASAAIQSVPEPTSIALLGLGFLAMGASSRRRA
jgi:hypothetical protein